MSDQFVTISFHVTENRRKRDGLGWTFFLCAVLLSRAEQDVPDDFFLARALLHLLAIQEEGRDIVVIVLIGDVRALLLVDHFDLDGLRLRKLALDFLDPSERFAAIGAGREIEQL